MSAFPVETSGARCEGPKKMHKRKLASLRQDQLKCYGEFFQNTEPIVQKSFFYAMINDTDGWSYNNDQEKEKCLHIKILYKQTYSKHSKQFEKAPGLLLMHTKFAMQMIFLGKKS